MIACSQCALPVQPAALGPGAERGSDDHSKTLETVRRILQENHSQHREVPGLLSKLQENREKDGALRYTKGGEAKLVILNNEVAFRLTKNKHSAYYPAPSLELTPRYLLPNDRNEPLVLRDDENCLEVWEAYDADLLSWFKKFRFSGGTRELARGSRQRVGEQLLRLCQKLAAFLSTNKVHWKDFRFLNIVIKEYEATETSEARVDLRVIDLDMHQFFPDRKFYDLLETTFSTSPKKHSTEILGGYLFLLLVITHSFPGEMSLCPLLLGDDCDYFWKDQDLVNGIRTFYLALAAADLRVKDKEEEEKRPQAICGFSWHYSGYAQYELPTWMYNHKLPCTLLQMLYKHLLFFKNMQESKQTACSTLHTFFKDLSAEKALMSLEQKLYKDDLENNSFLTQKIKGLLELIPLTAYEIENFGSDEAWKEAMRALGPQILDTYWEVKSKRSFGRRRGLSPQKLGEIKAAQKKIGGLDAWKEKIQKAPFFWYETEDAYHFFPASDSERVRVFELSNWHEDLPQHETTT